MQEAFHTLSIDTVEDLLYFFPHRYEAFPPVIKPWECMEDTACAVYVKIMRPVSVNVQSRTKTAVLDLGMTAEKPQKKIRAIWFHLPFVRSMLKPGMEYILYGKTMTKNGCRYLEQPQIFTVEQYRKLEGSLQPVYPLTKGISNNFLRKMIRQVLDGVSLEVEYMPDKIRARYQLCEYNYALEHIHFPESEADLKEARRRLVFDEFFLFLMRMKMARDGTVREKNPFHFKEDGFTEKLIKVLPYQLTDAQRHAVWDVHRGLRGEHVMQRLIQGDVGSGKTAVAFLAMLDASHSGYQAALMAPTDLLARQHYQKLVAFCSRAGIRTPVVLLTGSLKESEKKKARELIQTVPGALVVGTHALIQDKVEFYNLALVITDEQHRFGVSQRENLACKGQNPHYLVMSATPIPRTLAIILYGDLDISVIDEVPAKRIPIRNCVVTPAYRKAAYSFIEKQVQMGHQAYIVCPLVESSDGMEGENVTDYSSMLRNYYHGKYQVGMLHGRMKPEEKNRVMEQFLNREIQILVSTTVVEVGVDVPNATVMMIENAERFGLAQLHQLRGRVGRGDAPSYCIFMQGKDTKKKNRRLEVLNKSDDGFYIAGEDLKLRGPGDFFGVRQSGELSFQLADIYQDADLLQKASQEAALLMETDPKLTDEAHSRLRLILQKQQQMERRILCL